ncbi:TnsA-like heteromeric transposase endonuclease subunit [Deinococcus sp. Arct2-2]|uniref:TnsA-like heteromeric transposase endonuclease subunit n=1 Tax=Deinococcus sp. Arct2-2 TaxID=2568653 RepID=UPI001454DCC9|nr:TnsA-like heteromeric transposase endonuclease subunit [Deinococcus sp. Arct2-2]
MALAYRVTYQLDSGEVHDDQHPLLLAATPIQTLAPIRAPNNYRGQHHITGLHYSPNTGHLHAFESRLEQSALLRIDFELRPQAIATQPFALLYDDQGKRRGHIPDILVGRTHTRPLVIDVNPKVFVEKNAGPFSALRDACAEMGWDYAIWTEPNRAYASNLAFLYGYYRPLPGAASVTAALLDRLTPGPLPLADLEADLGSPCLIRPILFHLLWTKMIHADLLRPLTDSTLINREAA